MRFSSCFVIPFFISPAISLQFAQRSRVVASQGCAGEIRRVTQIRTHTQWRVLTDSQRSRLLFRGNLRQSGLGLELVCYFAKIAHEIYYASWYHTLLYTFNMNRGQWPGTFQVIDQISRDEGVNTGSQCSGSLSAV